jgi:hypothetical protein
VRAEGPSEELDRLRVVRKGDTLAIGRQNRMFGWGSSAKVKIYVTLPRLSEANIAGSGTMAVDRVDGERLGVNIAGSGSLDAAGLRAERAAVSVAGSGDVRAAVGGMADVSMMGSGNVDLGSSASCKVTKMGSGEVRCGK